MALEVEGVVEGSGLNSAKRGHVDDAPPRHSRRPHSRRAVWPPHAARLTWLFMASPCTASATICAVAAESVQPEMAVSGVVEDAGTAACADARHQARRHRPQAGPGHGADRADVREELLASSAPAGLMRSTRMSRFSPLNSAVPATRKRSRPRRLVTILVCVVEQADGRRRGPAPRIVEMDGDGVALHRVDVDAVAQHRGEAPAGDAGADHDGIDPQRLGRAGRPSGRSPGDGDAVRAMRDAGHVGLEQEAGAAAHAGLGQAARELVDVAGRSRRA